VTLSISIYVEFNFKAILANLWQNPKSFVNIAIGVALRQLLVNIVSHKLVDHHTISLKHSAFASI